MTVPSDRTNSEHYNWGDSCDGWRLLQRTDLSVIQERVPPGSAEINHYHHQARQFFFVLSGQATLEFKDDSITFDAGQGVHVEPGREHRFVNHSANDVEFLVISCPSTAGDRTNVQLASK
ncbi:MAG: cupin domain-containing protein [Acidobacteriota bacterium]